MRKDCKYCTATGCALMSENICEKRPCGFYPATEENRKAPLREWLAALDALDRANSKLEQAKREVYIARDKACEAKRKFMEAE